MAKKKADTRVKARTSTKPVKAAKKAAKPAKPAKPAKRAQRARPATSAVRTPWLDDTSSTPLIETYARRLDSFMTAVADGIIEPAELKAQEDRLVALMKEVEPLLDDAVHEKVTHLLCELTAYDLMQMLHSLQEARPMTVFHG
jgi:chemotaxis protein histidine kinase CheA